MRLKAVSISGNSLFSAACSLSILLASGLRSLGLPDCPDCHFTLHFSCFYRIIN